LNQLLYCGDGGDVMIGEQPILHGIGLSRSFGSGRTQQAVLHEVSADLYPRQLTLVMGPSGSGKSTLLAILSGLMRPSSGRVIALGEDLYRLGDRERKRFRLRHCGYIFQGYNLFPALTALQQLEMVLCWGEGAPARVARRRAEAMLDLLGLARKAGARPAELSGGEQQRVAIGRAMIKAPSLCFADEPTGALDWTHGRQVIELLQRAAHEDGASIVAVTHDPRLVPYADRVLHLEDGSLVESAPAAGRAGELPASRPKFPVKSRRAEFSRVLAGGPFHDVP
jgi:putative ABC transport system ATP-binding protein